MIFYPDPLDAVVVVLVASAVGDGVTLVCPVFIIVCMVVKALSAGLDRDRRGFQPMTEETFGMQSQNTVTTVGMLIKMDRSSTRTMLSLIMNSRGMPNTVNRKMVYAEKSRALVSCRSSGIFLIW